MKEEAGEIPLLGTYIIGQVYCNQEVGLVRAFNQNLMVVVFGEAELTGLKELPAPVCFFL